MRLPPNPNYLAEIEKTRDLVLKGRAKRGGVSIAVVASESGLHTNIVMRFMAGKIEHPTRNTVDSLRKWGDENKAARTPNPEKVQKDLGARIKSAYDIRKEVGESAEQMAMAAGVNRTVFSQLMNGTYTRKLRPYTLKSLNTWVDKALK